MASHRPGVYHLGAAEKQKPDPRGRAASHTLHGIGCGVITGPQNWDCVDLAHVSGLALLVRGIGRRKDGRGGSPPAYSFRFASDVHSESKSDAISNSLI
jgi:hypothetical protein